MVLKSESWYLILPVAFKKLLKMGDQFAQDCLKAHNEYRRKHGAQPLVLVQPGTLCNIHPALVMEKTFTLRWGRQLRAARPLMPGTAKSRTIVMVVVSLWEQVLPYIFLS